MTKPKPITTGMHCVDRALGGGIFPGLTLLSGPRGLGKSSLLLQIATRAGNAVVYVSGEQTANDLARISQRLKLKSKRVHVLDMKSGDCNNIDKIVETIERKKAILLIIDSAQAVIFNDVRGDAGSLSQMKALTSFLSYLTKSSKQLSIILVCHVYKNGNIAGPRSMIRLVQPSRLSRPR